MKNVKKTVKIASLALAGIIGATTVGFVARETASASPVEPRRVVLADFETFTDVQSITPVGNSQYIPLGTYNWTQPGDTNAIDGRSLRLYTEGSLSESWAGYAKDTGGGILLDYLLSHNFKDYGFEWIYMTRIGAQVRNANDFEVRTRIFIYINNRPVSFGVVSIPANTTKDVYVNTNRFLYQTELAGELFTDLCFFFDYDKKVLTEEDIAERELDPMTKPGDLYYDAAEIYVDNIYADVDENSIYDEDGKVIIDKKFESAEEILNFNQSADLRYVYETGANYTTEIQNEWNTTGYEAGTGSGLYYNTNDKYIHENNVGSLEWRLTPIMHKKYMDANYQYWGIFNYMNDHSMTGFTVAPAYLNTLNFSNLQNGKAKILVDVYNDCGFDKEVCFGIHDKSGIAMGPQYEWPYDYGKITYTDVWTKLPAGQWTTLELTDFSKIDLSKGLSRLRLCTSLQDVTEQVSFYVNNLRIVYEA